MSIVTLAVILPLLLFTMLGALQLFLYFRAVAVVDRAALEAGRMLAVSLPTESFLHPQSKIEKAAHVYSSSGGNIFGNINVSFTQHGILYTPATVATRGSVPLPFSLSTSVAKQNPATKHPGIHYLPMVSAWVCKEPGNETSHTEDECRENFANKLDQGFLHYQLPSRMDFDGDGQEDLAFFYANPDGDDWWVLPSSGGTMFRYALRVDTGNASGQNSLPCPADYDGDGKTDFCVLEAQGRKHILNIRLSAQRYERLHSFTLTLPNTATLLPVPGRWTRNTNVQFAAIVVNTKNKSLHLSTLVWPSFQFRGDISDTQAIILLQDKPKYFNTQAHKPLPGRYWRPAFGDYDGNGINEIGWLTWDGGYPTKIVASRPNSSFNTLTSITTADTNFTPWQLHYPTSEPSAGMYVVERNNHKISIINPGSDNIVNGDSSEHVVTIAGNTTANSPFHLATPDPLRATIESDTTVPSENQTLLCNSCYPGGSFSGDGQRASSAALNSPTYVTGGGSLPLFIADFGNRRVRVVSTGTDGLVNGSKDERITTIAGGNVPYRGGVECPKLISGNDGPSAGHYARRWDEYSGTATANGIHPRCVLVYPLSLAFDPISRILFIGDTNGVVFALYPGQDGDIDGSADERLSLIAGEYGVIASSSPTTSGRLGYPNAMEIGYFDDKTFLVVAYRLSTTEPIGGIVRLDPPESLSRGLFETTNTGRVITPAISNISGTWDATSKLRGMSGIISNNAKGSKAQKSIGRLFNPSALALHVSLKHTTVDSRINIFVTDWWNSSENNTYENSILNFISSSNSATVAFRWLSSGYLNNWGKHLPPDADSYSDLVSNSAPLSTIPLNVGAGLALSPDSRYLYSSQPALGQILITHLDKDADGLSDFASNISNTSSDNDIDGDGLINTNDQYPFFPDSNAIGPRNFGSIGRKITTFDSAQSPRIWGTTVHGRLNAGSRGVTRLEWWIDRFPEVNRIPFSASSPVSPQETPPYKILKDTTVALSLPPDSVQDQISWAGGRSMPTKFNGATQLPNLSPVILDSPTPSEFGFRHIAAFVDCPKWDTNPFLSENTMRLNGTPVTICGRNISNPHYSDGRTVGIRRAQLTHAANSWHSFQDNPEIPNELIFLDWDGNKIRNPVIFRNDRVPNNGSQPLTAVIGRLGSGKLTNSNPCPGRFALNDLRTLESVLRPQFSPPLASNEHQYSCNSKVPFLGHVSRTLATVLVDTHAEWRTSTHVSYLTLDKRNSHRLSTTHGEIGPVAETAYRVLETLLKVRRRHIAELPRDAEVTLQVEGENDKKIGVLTVRYVLPLNSVIAKLYGAPQVTIERTLRRHLHSSIEDA